MGQRSLARAGLRPADIQLFVHNTPTAWFHRYFAALLDIDPGRTVTTYPWIANTGPVLVPANLHFAAARGRLAPVFGVPGGHLSPFLGALRRQDRVRFIIAAHEGGAAFMADGYARASGKPGVCLVTAGPGATNALTGLAAAHLDGVPVLVISGQVPPERWGLGSIQESTGESGVDVVAAFRHAAAYSAGIVDVRSFARQFGWALAVLHGRPGGAVHLSIPASVARATLDRASVAGWSVRGRCARPRVVLDDATREVHRRIVAARRPLVYLGSGAREALADLGEGLRAWVERRGIAVVTSVRGKGLFPSTRRPRSACTDWPARPAPRATCETASTRCWCSAPGSGSGRATTSRATCGRRSRPGRP